MSAITSSTQNAQSTSATTSPSAQKSRIEELVNEMMKNNQAIRKLGAPGPAAEALQNKNTQILTELHELGFRWK